MWCATLRAAWRRCTVGGARDAHALARRTLSSTMTARRLHRTLRTPATPPGEHGLHWRATPTAATPRISHVYFLSARSSSSSSPPSSSSGEGGAGGDGTHRRDAAGGDSGDAANGDAGSANRDERDGARDSATADDVAPVPSGDSAAAAESATTSALRKRQRSSGGARASPLRWGRRRTSATGDDDGGGDASMNRSSSSTGGDAADRDRAHDAAIETLRERVGGDGRITPEIATQIPTHELARMLTVHSLLGDRYRLRDERVRDDDRGGGGGDDVDGDDGGNAGDSARETTSSPPSPPSPPPMGILLDDKELPLHKRTPYVPRDVIDAFRRDVPAARAHRAKPLNTRIEIDKLFDAAKHDLPANVYDASTQRAWDAVDERTTGPDEQRRLPASQSASSKDLAVGVRASSLVQASATSPVYSRRRKRACPLCSDKRAAVRRARRTEGGEDDEARALSERAPTDFRDINVLARFVTESGKIMPRRRTGCCAKHQRRMAHAVKHARNAALIDTVRRPGRDLFGRPDGLIDG